MSYFSDRAKRGGWAPVSGESLREHSALSALRSAAARREQKARGVGDLFPEVAAEDDPTGNERYTTRETIDWCKRAIGGRLFDFDLDVAACAESHWAQRYYTKADNGLVQPWDAATIWCNPPYSDIEPWVTRAWEQMRGSKVIKLIAMLIPATRTEQRWWQTMVEPFRDGAAHEIRLRTKFLPGRTAFARPGSGGVGQSGAPFGCVLLVWKRS